MAKLDNIRHSLAHLLAAAVLKKFADAKLGIGPTIENGFYYDFLLPRNLTREDLDEFEREMRGFIAENLTFKGEKVTAEKAKKLFKNQPFKLELIKELVKHKKPLMVYHTFSGRRQAAGGKSLKNDTACSLSHGSCFFDLCRGGHVKNTKEINPESFRLEKTAGAYWRGDAKNPQLQRIYGVAFSSKEELDEYLKLQEETEKRDHRKLGERLDMFHFEDVAPGAAFWHGKGMIVWRELEKFMREKLDREGYEEVSTPVMVKKEVFEKSGHFQHYKENMFYFSVPGEKNEIYVLKPMNCPESTYIYNFKPHSYRDLPLRLSEITDRLHRNELSGVLGGLFRVRQMTQDDAHIYCRPEQIESEINNLLELVKSIYKHFDLPLNFNLATRPDKAMGDSKLWKKAEAALKHVLEKSGLPYKIKPKDGAFYGPKIDINTHDSLKREWTVATIQLDFQLSERFDLSYINEKGKKERPVVIHRAILGTFERFIGIILEHFAGVLPLWLAPVQVLVIPVGVAHEIYAAEITEQLRGHGIRAEAALQNETVGKKIRDGEMRKIPYILVVGSKELANRTVNVRHYRRGQEGEMPLGKLTEIIIHDIKEKII